MRIGVGLSIPELATRGGKFSPASLFAGGVQGVWYSPDDYSTLFQDSAGTTPVTAVEQPVGLMLDKSQGLVLGSELVTNPGPFTNTTGYSTSNATLAVVSGEIEVTATASTGYVDFNFTAVAGTWYRVQITAYVSSGSLQYRLSIPGAFDTAFKTNTTAATTTCYVLASGASLAIRAGFSGTIGDKYRIVAESAKALPGNHASQATSTSRPVLRARYNQLTYSEQFDTARWAVGTYNTTGIDNDRIAPDGTTTADKITVVVSGNNRLQQVISVVPNTNYTVSFYVYGGTSTSYLMNIYDSIGATWIVYAYDYSAQVSTTGWARITKSFTTPAGCTSIVLQPIRDVIGTGTFWIWGADLRTGSSAGTYQRIAAATDYATAGFLPYLAFDGTDDSFGTNSINFSATDKMSVCAGVTKLSDAAAAILFEFSSNFNTNSGTFAVTAPETIGASGDYVFVGRGTALPNVNQQAKSSVLLAPITNVVTGTGNISGNLNALRINGLANGTTGTGGQGTGNYGNYPLFIGRRNNASLPFNGRIYQLVVCGKTLSAAELASTEAYVNSKTGAY